MLSTSEEEAAGGSSGKESTCQCRRRDLGPILGLGRSPGEGNGYPHQFLAREIPWAEEPVGLQSRGAKKSRTLLRDTHTQTCAININYYIDPQNGPAR